MWILFTLLAAFFNALWTAIIKQGKTSSTLIGSSIFRAFTAIFLLPAFILNSNVNVDANIVFLTLIAGLFESLKMGFLFLAMQRDYYSGICFANTSPVLNFIFAPIFIASESYTIAKLIGILLTVGGIFVFYRGGRFSLWGMLSSLSAVITIISAKAVIIKTNAYYFTFFMALTSSIFGYLFHLIFRKRQESVGIRDLPYPRIIIGAFLSFIATILYYLAIGMGSLISVGALVRFNVIFGFLLNVYYHGEREAIKTKLVGGSLIAIGGMSLILEY